MWHDFTPWRRSFLILLSGNVETNPGPKSIFGQSFLIGYWNLNGISAQSYTEIFVLTAYVLFHNFDIICLSKTYLSSKTSPDDQILEVPGYYILCADHSSNNKRGGVCIFYKTTFPLIVLNKRRISYV